MNNIIDIKDIFDVLLLKNENEAFEFLKNFKNVDNIILNQLLIDNLRNKNFDFLNKILIDKGANKEILNLKVKSLASIKFNLNNPNFWRKKANFCEKDKILTKRILFELGNPQKNIGKVIHITGSNGKGSTAAFIENILKINGYKVNKFTSPSLIKSNENIVINGQEVDDEEYYECLLKIKKIYDKLMLDNNFVQEILASEENELKNKRILYKKNYIGVADWSFIVPIVMLLFSKHKADISIIEVINGGLKDFTNIFTENEILTTIITFTQYGIGSNDGTMKVRNKNNEWVCDNKATAYHKAMLSKKNCPMIIANQTNDVLKEIRSVVKENGAYALEYNKDWFIENETEGSFIFKGFDKVLQLNKPKTLIEKFQTMNIATAISAILSQNEFKINCNLIQEAIDNTEIIGRLQYIKDGFYKKYFNNCNIITGYIKFNKSGLESIDDILSKLKGNKYILYTTGNKKTFGENKDFFNIIKKFDKVKLTIYKKNEETFNQLIKEVIDSKVEYKLENSLSQALIECKKNINFNEKNNILILCNSMKNFDKDIVLLNKAIY